MTETLNEQLAEEKREWRERIASAVELCAERLGGPDRAMANRVATLEDLLKEFVGIMDNPNSSNEEWADLLQDVKQALGIEASS